MTNLRWAVAILSSALVALCLVAQQVETQAEPRDLRFEVRSATGSTQFQMGEVIPLEIILSSSTPSRYLEPCELFSTRTFGFPQCRFFSRWSFEITPREGWVDYTKLFQGPFDRGGPTFEVPDHDLTSVPTKFSYSLTERFRFDKPGDYKIKLSVDVGLDDETTKRFQPAIKPHFVTLSREIVLHIVLASAEWQTEIVNKGSEAYSAPAPRPANPPTPEFVKYQKATEALCAVGTVQAARLLGRLLSQEHYELKHCLFQSPNTTGVIQELRRLVVEPDVAVNHIFFSALVGLQNWQRDGLGGEMFMDQEVVDRERDLLFTVLPTKDDDAQITSLETVLENPPRTRKTRLEYWRDAQFPPPVIMMLSEKFADLPWHTQRWLLTDGWERVRSPLMLPLLRRQAQGGDGEALLRWLELDPAPVTAFVRAEIVRPVPRLSAYYLRVPDAELPQQEQEIAANFVALKQVNDLVRSATLLHRYATRKVLDTVLPFIDEKRATWPCYIQYPALAYLLKVAPDLAAPRLESALREANHGPCNTQTFLTDMGSLEPSPVLDQVAAEQIDSAGEFARNGADYLNQYGSPNMKAAVWDRLVRSHREYMASGAEKRFAEGKSTMSDSALGALDHALMDAYVEGLGWTLTPQDADKLRDLLGEKTTDSVSCRFRCGAPLFINPNPGDFTISVWGTGRVLWREFPLEYLNPMESVHFSVNQYHCRDVRCLKEKLLQFPPGSSFRFTYSMSSEQGTSAIVEISDFLWEHGYVVRNPEKRSFLRPDPSSGK